MAYDCLYFRTFLFSPPSCLSLLLTFAWRESSPFGLDPGIRRHQARKFKHLLQKQAFFGARRERYFRLAAGSRVRRTREVDRRADINKNSLPWINRYLCSIERKGVWTRQIKGNPSNQQKSPYKHPPCVYIMPFNKWKQEQIKHREKCRKRFNNSAMSQSFAPNL